MDNTDPWAPCETCDKEFRSQDAAGQHMNGEDHWAPGFYCETCDKESQDAAGQHMDDKDYWALGFHCETYDEEFYAEDAADQHINGNGGWAPGFYCEACGEEFYAEDAADQHMSAVEHWKSPTIDKLEKLNSGGKTYKTVKKQFDDKWRHTKKTGRIRAIYLDKRYSTLKKLQPGWRCLFHGTQRACYIGDLGHSLELCNNSECRLCSILQNSFEIEYVGSRGRRPKFGSGIYTTSISSKADTYVRNNHIRSNLYAMLLCLVFVGRSEKLFRLDRWRTSPSDGYDSIVAATKTEGGAVTYPMTVVYSEDAIIPIGLIMYTRG